MSTYTDLSHDIKNRLQVAMSRKTGRELATQIQNLITDIQALPLASMRFQASTTLTIAAGVVTANRAFHKIDTEAAAASDDLDSIAGGTARQFLLVTAANDARTVVIKNSASIICPGGQDVTLAEDDDYALLFCISATVWVVIATKVLSLSGVGLGAALASVANAKGASLVGIEDALTYITAANVEAALAEIATIVSDVANAVDGLHAVRIARATFDPSANAGQRTIGPHGLGVTLPDKAIIRRSWYQVKTTFTSATDAGTIALHAQAANDIKLAVAISNGANPYDAGFVEGIQTGGAAAFVQCTAARELTATVAVEALTVGKLVLFVEYVIGY